jgi:hypothetical protein
LEFAKYVELFFEVVVLGSGKGAMKKRSILGIDEEVKIEMVGNDRSGGGRHEQRK